MKLDKETIKHCPLETMCSAICNKDIYKIIGINNNHISCDKYKTNNTKQ